ncbi:hypothetical protein ABZZ36_32380 [Actinacidiphila glaucinigra]|uniref:hypothetical protein n=1 Tax=Actinacidiphila glaucinigra TaxID=235986 RepID=UPI0033A5395F
MNQMDSSAFAILAAAVAAQLGPDWNARPDSGFQAGARLACEDGRGIALVLHGRSITARGVLPHRPRLAGRPDAPSITMAATTAEYVTKHIRRRLMTAYDAALTATRLRIAQVTAEQTERARIADRLAHALTDTPARTEQDTDVSVQVCPFRQRDTTRVVRYRPGEGVTVLAEVSPGAEHVDIDLKGLTPNHAEQILTLYRQLRS